MAAGTSTQLIQLPEPSLDGSMSVEAAIQNRRSIRSYAGDPLSLAEAGQLLWSAQGNTGMRGERKVRAAPSAGGLNPMETYLVVGDVTGLQPAVYRYLPEQHSIEIYMEGDLRNQLKTASLDQQMILDAPASIVFTAIYERTTWKYKQRGYRYVHMDVGCAAENVFLQGVALGIGSVFIGAFRDEQVSEVLSLPEDEIPLCIIPLGKLD